MICPDCGKEYNEKMTCCISCGADLVPYEQDSEQTRFDPVIPEADIESIPVTKGFERSLAGHSEYPPEPEIEIEIPVERISGTARASRAVCGIGSFAAALTMFAMIVLAFISASVRLLTDGKNISRFAEQLDVMSLPAAQTVMLAEYDYEIPADATVQEAIFIMSEGTGLTREDIRKIYENSTMRDFLAARLDEYAEFIRRGEMPEKLTTEKLKEVFSENLSLISGAIGKPLCQHDIDLAFAELDRTQPVLEAIAPAKIENTVGEAPLTLLRLASSAPVLICEAAAAAAMLIVLYAINRRAGSVLSWGGGAALAGGAAALAATFLFDLQVFIPGGRLVKSVAKCAAEVVAPDMYRFGAGLALIGAVMLIWAATLRKKA